MTTKSRRPVASLGTGPVGGWNAQGHQAIEAEIERSRDTEIWEHVLELAESLRTKPDKNIGMLVDFLVGEAKLEGYLKKTAQSSVVPADVPEIAEAKQALLKAAGDDAKHLHINLDSYILLGKLHYSQGRYTEALQYYQRAGIDKLDERVLPPRSLKIMAEAFAIRAMCLEKTSAATATNKSQQQEKEQQIIKSYETASDLTLLFLQFADRTASFGQSTWSVASVGTTGSTSPTPVEEVRPKIGPILESSLYKAAALNMNRNKLLKAVARLRNMLMAEESESLKEIRRNVCCQLAEVLISNCGASKYTRPDLDVIVPRKNAWKPIKQAGSNLFTPRNKHEELLLILLLSENIANKGAVLSQGPGSATGRKATYEAATVTYDLLTLTLCRFNNYKLLSMMLERSMKFSFQERHTWEQFAYVLSTEGRFFRSLLVVRDMAERLTMDAGCCLSSARMCYEKLGLFEEGIEWAKRAIETEKAKSNKYLEARCFLCMGLGHLLASNRIENLRDKMDRVYMAGDAYASARSKDNRDHLIEFRLAFYYAQMRQIKLASQHVRNALDCNPFHFPSLHLMILLLTSNKEFDEALKLAEQTLEEFPEQMEMWTLKIKLEEFVHGSEAAMYSAKDMMLHWQSVEETNQRNDANPNNFAPTARSSYAFSPSVSSSVMPTTMMTNAAMDDFAAPFDSHSADRDSMSFHPSHISYADKTLSDIQSSPSGGRFPQLPNSSYSLMRIWVLIAEIYLWQGDCSSAEQCAEEAKQLTPYSYHVANIKGLVEEAKGNYEEARQLFENALALNPINPCSLDNLARTYYHMKHYRLAADSARVSLSHNPYNKQSWSLLGRIYEALSKEIGKEAQLFENEGEEDVLISSLGLLAPSSESVDSLASRKDGEEESSVEEDSLKPPEDFVVSPLFQGGIPDLSPVPDRLVAGVESQQPEEVEVSTCSPAFISSMLYRIPLSFKDGHAAEYKATTKVENVDDVARKAATAAECQAVALALHGTEPIVPFGTIPVTYD